MVRPIEIEINKETLLETENSMQSNTSKFYGKFKGNLTNKSAQAADTVLEPKENKEISQFREKLKEVIDRIASEDRS